MMSSSRCSVVIVPFVAALVLLYFSQATTSFLVTLTSRYTYSHHHDNLCISTVLLNANGKGGFGSGGSTSIAGTTVRKGKTHSNRSILDVPAIDLTNEAKKYLKKHNNNIDAASADYFRSQMDRLIKSNDLIKQDVSNLSDDLNTENRKVYNEILLDKESVTTAPTGSTTNVLNSMQPDDNTHEARVAVAWNTIAMFLPCDYSRSRGRIDPQVDRRMKHIAEAAWKGFKNPTDEYILDVGCGDGSLVPYLYQVIRNSSISQENIATCYKLDTNGNLNSHTQMGKLSNYFGLDISSVMIDLSKQRWMKVVEGSSWIVGSFPVSAYSLLDRLRLKSASANNSDRPFGYSVIIFNGSLQFFKNTTDILKHAISLLQPGGKIVIAHVQGADFVKDECRRNPGIAVRQMPNNITLQIIAHDLGLAVVRKNDMGLEYFDHDLDGEDGKFYLVVLQKK